jgi:type IV secretion system protein TrbB
VGSVPIKPEAASRSIGMLRTAMGAITSWLDDPAIVEVMLNPDGRLWIDRLAGGLSDTGKRLSAQDGERIVRVVAHHVGAEVHPGSPRISAELPVHGERFEGLLPPIVAAPTFAIRKPAVAIFTLTDYVKAGIVPPDRPSSSARPLPGAATSWSPAAPQPARRRSSMRCLPKWRGRLIVSS